MSSWTSFGDSLTELSSRMSSGRRQTKSAAATVALVVFAWTLVLGISEVHAIGGGCTAIVACRYDRTIYSPASRTTLLHGVLPRAAIAPSPASGSSGPATALRVLSTAAEDVTAGGTRLFRVTGPNETADIEANGAYRLAKGRVGKSFYPTEEQAVNLARMYNESGIGGPYTLTSGVFSPDLMAELEPFSPPGGRGAGVLRSRAESPGSNLWGVQIHGPVP